MLKTEVIEKIRAFFSTKPVEKVFLFGSYARGEHNDESDLDLLLEFEKNAKIGLTQYSRMKIDIEEALKLKVDLLTKESLSPHLKALIMSDIIKIYEKKQH